MSTQRNKVYSVTTISQVAKQLGIDEETLWDVATQMEPEDGLIWVYGLNDTQVMAFSNDGIESLQELLATHLAIHLAISLGKRKTRRADRSEKLITRSPPDG